MIFFLGTIILEVFSSLIVAGNLSRSPLIVMDIEDNNKCEGDHKI